MAYKKVRKSNFMPSGRYGRLNCAKIGFGAIWWQKIQIRQIFEIKQAFYLQPNPLFKLYKI